MKAGGQRVERQRLMDYSSRRGENTLSSAEFFAQLPQVWLRCRATASSEPLLVRIIRFNHPHWRSPAAGYLAIYSAVARFLKDFPLASVFNNRTTMQLYRKAFMKNPIIVIALLASTLAGVQAQVNGSGATTIAKQPAVPVPTAFSPVSRDASSTVWERTVYERGTNGTIVPRKSRYTELSTGLNFLQNGQWRPSRAEISLLPPGGAFAAAATQGSHKASFPLDIAQGVIQLSTPEGKQLTSRPVGLFLEDDKNSALIAILTNSVGELVGSNQVVYPDAFEGVAASIRYRYTRAGFEQDVLIQGSLPNPAALGLNPARTRLGVLTAFFDTNNPVETPAPADPQTGLSDTTLTFGGMAGGMTMVPGRAFVVGNPNQHDFPRGGTPTYKRWFRLNGRNFLIEEVPYPRVAPQLEQLPQTGRAETIATNLFAANSVLDQFSAPRSPLPARGAEVKPQQMRLARTDWDQRRAFVLDYLTLNNSLGDTVLQGDTTYRVSGLVYCFGAMTIEGGAVIKYDKAGGAALFLAGTVNCQTTPYHPAVFTAIDDNTVGEPIGTGSPSGYYADDALLVYASTQPTVLHDLRISHALNGIVAANPGVRYLIRDCQICKVACGIHNYFAQSVMVENSLIYQASQAAFNSYYTPCAGAQLTVDQVGAVCVLNYGGTLCLTNSLLVGVTNLTGGYISIQSLTDSSDSGYFQTVGGASHYLADNTYRGAGTVVNLDPSLLAELTVKTTYPPLAYANTQITSGIITTPPQRPRDTGSPGPDLGYHYDPLDYIFTDCEVDSSMTFPAGSAVGWQGQGLSFSGSFYALKFDGTVIQPCYFVRCNTVQEADNSGNGTGIAGSSEYPQLAATSRVFPPWGIWQFSLTPIRSSLG
jgi:hypothetical protein